MDAMDLRKRGGRSPFPLTALLTGIAVLFLASASSAATAPKWGACLDCHEDSSLSMTSARGEAISLTVAAAELAASAHRSLECRACHPGVDLDSHPDDGVVASLEAFRTRESRACLGCHKPAKLRELSQHAGVVFEDQQLACVECHGSHGVKMVAAWKQAGAPNDYCLTCHAKPLTLQRPDGTPLSLTVDAAKLSASVHPDHRCTDCHADFSATSHPGDAGGEKGERAMAAARACGECHDDKFKQAEGSIHFSLLRSGASGAPGCTQCHSAHEVAPKERFATLSGSPCRSCHAEIFAAYSGSMHGKARGSGDHFEAPLCSECHRAHDVQGTARAEQIRTACYGCHPTAAAVHAVWLPNAALHLEAISCAACHAPQAKRVVALRLVEEGSGRQLTEREVGDLLGGDAASKLDPTGKGMDGLGLWSAIRKLEAGRDASAAKLHVSGRLEVARGIDAHRLADKAGAVRDCETCHRADSPSFDRVALVLGRDDGRPKRFEGSPEMLTDAAAVVPLHGFYALGATRAKVLDYVLILAVAGGFGVIALHLSARIWSARTHKEG